MKKPVQHGPRAFDPRPVKGAVTAHRAPPNETVKHDKDWTEQLVAPVARCLAQLDDRFIDAAQWQGKRRAEYEERARRVLQTIKNVQAGNQTGGL